MKNDYFRFTGALAALAVILCFAACPTESGTGPGTGTLGESVMPEISQTTVAKDTDTQAEVRFTITGTAPVTGAVFKVYDGANSAVQHSSVTAVFQAEEGGNFLVLKATSDVPAGDYYVSVTETRKTESTRTALTVAESGVSVMPDIQQTTVLKDSGTQAEVKFTITGTAPAAGAVFKVYADNATETVHGTVTAEFRADEGVNLLVLKATTNVPIGTYYVSLSEDDKTESARTVLTVNSVGASVMPNIHSHTVIKDFSDSDEAAFTVSGTLPDEEAEFKVYANNETGEVHATVTAELRTANNLLVLIAEDGVPVGTYYVSVIEEGKEESARTALTVELPTVKFYDGPESYSGTSLKPLALGPSEEETFTVSDQDGTLGGNMPADPTLAGYDFAGWWTEPRTGGKKVEASTVIEEHMHVYGRWTLKTGVAELVFQVDASNNFTGTYYNASGQATGETVTAKLLGNTPPSVVNAGYENLKLLKAVSLGGQGGYIDLGREAAMLLNNPTGSWTMEVYANIPTNAPTGDHLISVMQNDADQAKGVLWVETDNTRLRKRTSYDPSVGEQNTNNPGAGRTGRWIALTYLRHTNSWVDAMLNLGNSVNGNMASGLVDNDNLNPLNFFFLGRNPNSNVTTADIQYYKVILRPTVDTPANYVPLYRAAVNTALNELNTWAAVTFDADGGSWDGVTTTKVGVVSGATTIGDDSRMPINPVKANSLFDGWYTEKDGAGTEFTATSAVTGDKTVYAKWEQAGLQAVVTFHANGGLFSGQQTVTVNTTTGNSLGSSMPTEPTRGDNTFMRYNTKADGSGEFFGPNTAVADPALTVYAQWRWAVIENTFTANDVQRVRLTVYQSGPATRSDNEHRLQIHEMELLNEAGANVLRPGGSGLTATVTPSNATFTAGGWSIGNLTDGVKNSDTDNGWTSVVLNPTPLANSAGVSYTYSSTSQAGVGNGISFEFTLGTATSLRGMKLYARNGTTTAHLSSEAECANYPKQFSLEVWDSESGVWNIVELSGYNGSYADGRWTVPFLRNMTRNAPPAN